MIRFAILVWAGTALWAQDAPRFDDHFINGVLRFDFYHGFDKSSHTIVPYRWREEPFYAGSKTVLVPPMDMGNFRYDVMDSASGQLIYSEGYSDLFEEWKSTREALEGGRQVFLESVRFPYPRATVVLKLFARDRSGAYFEMYSETLNPRSLRIDRSRPSRAFETGDISLSGLPEDKIDVLFLAEGYTSGQTAKFKADARKLADYLVSKEPFRTYRDRFNFRYVAAVSEEGGTDEPDRGIFKRTILSSSFNTFNIERYITTMDHHTLRELASAVPYDHVVVLTNHERYGGAGFYNFYSIFCSDMPELGDVFVHEFGHQFAGLADEYDGDFTQGEPFYNLKIEPWEANITTSRKRQNIKWNSVISKDTPIPTPNDAKYANVVGCFEGGGYSTKGIFRSQLYCLMRGWEVREFCHACREQCVKMLKLYTR